MLDFGLVFFNFLLLLAFIDDIAIFVQATNYSTHANFSSLDVLLFDAMLKEEFIE